MAFRSAEERNRWVPRDLAIYSDLRCPMALGGPSSQQRLVELRAE